MASLTQQHGAASKPRLPEGHSPACRKSKTLENCNEKATWTSMTRNAGDRILRNKDQPFASRSSTVFPKVSRCKELLLLLECFASGKGESPFSVSEISRGSAPAGWRLQRDLWDNGILEQQHEGIHSSVTPRKNKGEGSNLG